MKWVTIERDANGSMLNAPPDGKYVVKTKSNLKYSNLQHVLQVELHTHVEKGKTKHHWTCKNQEVTHYLDENPDI